jgi:hypothetical protein
MPRRRFALPQELQPGDLVLMVDNPLDGLTWRPGTETSYYEVATQPERKIMDVRTQSGMVPRHTWWFTVSRDASAEDAQVWSDGGVIAGKVVRRAFFLEDHAAAVKTP